MTKAQELQLMIRHPNNSGLQRDPLTQYFIPAHFVQTLSISQADRPILSMEGGISISEDPNFRFDFTAQGTARSASRRPTPMARCSRTNGRCSRRGFDGTVPRMQKNSKLGRSRR